MRAPARHWRTALQPPATEQQSDIRLLAPNLSGHGLGIALWPWLCGRLHRPAEPQRDVSRSLQEPSDGGELRVWPSHYPTADHEPTFQPQVAA